MNVRRMLDEISADELNEWMGWFHLKQQTERADREQEAMVESLAESVDGGIVRAKSWQK